MLPFWIVAGPLAIDGPRVATPVCKEHGGDRRTVDLNLQSLALGSAVESSSSDSIRLAKRTTYLLLYLV